MRQFWNSKKVLREIRKMYNSGLSLTYVDIRDHNESLLNASNRYFGSWRNAVRKAGFVPQYVHKYITKDDVVNEIKKRWNCGQKLNSRTVDLEDPALYSAGRKKFGSWLNVIQASGLTPQDIGYQFKTKWTKKKIKEKIKSLNCDLNSRSIQKSHYSLYSHSVKKFGSWDKSLKASGLDPKKIRKNGFWNRQYVTDKILERCRKKQSICASDVETTFLHQKAREYFGTWGNALEYLKLKPTRKKTFFGEEILCRILRSFFPDAQFYMHKKFDWLKSKLNRRMHLDVFSKQLNLAAEFQGPSHFLPIFGIKELKKQKENDLRKVLLCDEHGIKLIRIKYNKLSVEHVSKELNKFGVTHSFSCGCDHLCQLYKKGKFKKIKV